jgi:hypothetical protein
MENSNQLNAYTITWAIIQPVKGKITKKDLNIMFRNGLYSISASKTKNEFTAHFPNKDSAIVRVMSLKGLSRLYKVVFITDKQFGMQNVKESLINVATKKQLIEMKFI